jgi:hypothetical protein
LFDEIWQTKEEKDLLNAGVKQVFHIVYDYDMVGKGSISGRISAQSYFGKTDH